MTVITPQTNFTAGEFAPALYAHSDLAKYKNAARRMKNFYAHASGGTSNRGGTEFVAEVKNSAKVTRLIEFQFSTVQSYVLEFSENSMRVIKDGGIVVNPVSLVEVVVTTPYADADIKLLKFTQSADIMYITHPSYAVRKLSRTDHHAWTLSTVTFTSSVSAPTNLYNTGSGAGNPCQVTAVDANGNESLIASYKSGYTKAIVHPNNTVYWDAVTGASYYNIYKDATVSASDTGKCFGWIARTTGTQYTEPSERITPDYQKSPPEAYNPFNGTNNYPGVCSFFEQRLLFGRTNNFPQSIYGSRTGDFENMDRSVPLRDDDSFKFTMNSNKVNEVRWMVPMNVLLVGTSGSEWRVMSGSKTNVITPSSVDMKAQSHWGVSHVRPAVVGTEVLFVDASDAKIRNFQYDVNVDAYAGGNLTVLAPHLFKNYKIIDMAYQQHPDSILWCVRDDGTLLGMTYYKEHDIYAWHRHETDGAFESICCVTSAADITELYVIVKRTIDGSEKRYIERFRDRLPIGENHTIDIADAYFVDCGLTYEGVPADEFSGLDHLEGKDVVALADGNVIKGLTVVNGAITLPRNASKVHIGLPYTCDIETMDFDFPTVNSPTAMDKQRQVVSVLMQLENTRSLFVGPNEARLDEVAFRSDEDYGEATKLFSGDKEKSIEPGNERESRVFIRVDDPLPVTILSIIPRIDYEEN